MTRDKFGVTADVSAVVEVNGHSPWSVFCCIVCLQRFNVPASILISIGAICCTSVFRQSSQYSSVCFLQLSAVHCLRARTPVTLVHDDD